MSRIHTVAEAIQALDAHIREEGSGYAAWYCGIAADAEDRLFSDHNVPKKNAWWIRRNCGTDTAARRVEKHFLAKGCDGGRGGGDSNTTWVYAYRITQTTVEAA
jgi:hypothetical protein